MSALYASVAVVLVALVVRDSILRALRLRIAEHKADAHTALVARVDQLEEDLRAARNRNAMERMQGR